MATITVNVSDRVEHQFRERAYQLYGKRKGMLGKALTEAMLDWTKKKEYFDRCMVLLERGVNLGKIKYKERAELYDRT